MMNRINIFKILPVITAIVLSSFFLFSCSSNSSNIINEINVGLHNNNELKIQLDVKTIKNASVFAEYWIEGEKDKMTTLLSPEGLQHKLILTNLIPDTNYNYQLTSIYKGEKVKSKIYNFKSNKLPLWLRDQFVSASNPSVQLPSEFKEGYMLMNKRETPGIAYIVDYKGRLRWYHSVDGTGYKVVNFTKDTTILGILGKNDEPTSYGSEILEVNMLGDTLLYLKKGQGDLNYSIHHEILKKNSDTYLTLFVDQRVMDLSNIGGGKKDTINGDGILMLDRNGKAKWRWSVFDVIDPLKDPQLLKTKKDWMHANSLNFDKDSNFIISFYNLGQIWKLNAATGKIMWKYGKGGDVKIPDGYEFSESHAVHLNAAGSMLFFDNGVEKKQSSIFAVKLNEASLAAEPDFHFKLPVDIYNERMGSAYMVADSLVLCCCSKKHFTVLANKEGAIFWKMQTAIPPYRVEFIQSAFLAPYLKTIKKEND